MTVLHHLFANYSDEVEWFNLTREILINRKEVDPNHVTVFGETACDLAIVHKLEKALSMVVEFRDRFEFARVKNDSGCSILHKAV